MQARSIRRMLAPFERSPLHPQWFVGAYRRSRRRLLESARGSVLDIGCAGKALADELPKGCSYIGLDLYDTARNYYGTRPDLYADAAAMPLIDASVDTVALLEVLEHVPDPDIVLAEIHRVLRPHGQLLLTVPFLYPIHDAPYDFHRFTRYALTKHLKQQGFTVIRCEGRLRSLETAGLLTSLALADAARLILERHRLAIPLIPVIGLLIFVSNLSAWLLARLLPTSDFMPGGYALLAVREP